jgi:hypothetical protein
MRINFYHGPVLRSNTAEGGKEDGHGGKPRGGQAAEKSPGAVASASLLIVVMLLNPLIFTRGHDVPGLSQTG